MLTPLALFVSLSGLGSTQRNPAGYGTYPGSLRKKNSLTTDLGSFN